MPIEAPIEVYLNNVIVGDIYLENSDVQVFSFPVVEIKAGDVLKIKRGSYTTSEYTFDEKLLTPRITYNRSTGEWSDWYIPSDETQS